MSKRTTRIYTRTRNGVTRFYLDLRSLGGTQEALVAPGDRSATTDPDIAADIAAKLAKAAPGKHADASGTVHNTLARLKAKGKVKRTKAGWRVA